MKKKTARKNLRPVRSGSKNNKKEMEGSKASSNTDINNCLLIKRENDIKQELTMSGVGRIDNIADTNVDKLASSKRVLKTVDLALTQALKLVVVDSALDSALTLLHAQCLGKENEDTKPDVKFLESIIFSDVQSEPSHKSIEEPVSVASKVKSLQNFPSGRLDKKTDIKVHQAQLSLSPPHKPNILLAERPNIFELFADVYRMADSNQSNVEHDPAKTSRERGDNDCHPVGSHGNILMGEHSLSGSEAAVLQRAEKVQSPRFEDASVQAKRQKMTSRATKKERSHEQRHEHKEDHAMLSVSSDTAELCVDKRLQSKGFAPEHDQESCVRKLCVLSGNRSASAQRKVDSEQTIDPIQGTGTCVHKNIGFKRKSSEFYPKSYAQQHVGKQQSGQKNSKKSLSEKLFVCDICGQGFKKKKYLCRHSISHSNNRPFLCKICSKTFKTKFQLQRHRSAHTGEKRFACDLCDKAFNQKSHLQRHRVIHTGEKSFKCPVCDKAYWQEYEMMTHLRVHTGESLFHCELCGRRYRQRNCLLEHLRTHIGEKPYSCEICGKRFCRLGEIRQHRTMHKSLKPYECDLCGNAFSRLSHLRSHLLIHVGAKPLKCETCGKHYRTWSILITHRKTHNLSRTFSCDKCKKSFREEADLIAHKRCHTGEKPFECAVCLKAFCQRGSLYHHRKKCPKKRG